ncbi:MAG: tetratricopeptide repeat protein [Deltaproteobacteria bacterium]|nr:tetratricopeptide repeat protein [Deltaproteobacteria bacterium]
MSTRLFVHTPPTRIALRSFAFAVGLATAALGAGRAEAAVDPAQSRGKMVELNKEALLSYNVKDWVTAKDLLDKALQEATLAGLEDNNMTARTYVHLGAVYWVGFQDRAKAVESFAMAKKIRSDIQLTPAIETPELKALFDSATDEAIGGQVAPSEPQPATPVETDASRYVRDGGDGEPALPETMSDPLMCTVPSVVPPNRELTLRCALQPGLDARLVQVHFRTPGVEAYQALGMRRTAQGWYVATLPRSAMKPGMLQVYFDARDESDKPVASVGQTDSPSVIAVRKLGSRRRGARSDDPMAHINEMIMAEQYEAGLHRRREGAIWFGVGGGIGWGYVPGGYLEWEQNVKVSALTTTTGLFHLVPELGYMLSDNFALALQGRIGFIQQEQARYVHPLTGQELSLAASLSGAPATMAPAGFARIIGYSDLSDDGNLRISYSADIGGGFVRFPVRPVAVVNYDSEKDEYVPDYNRTIAKTDTRPVGMFLAGAGLGFLWNLSRHFAISFDGRCFTGLPNWGAVVDGSLSLHVAFGGVHGPEVAPEEEEDVSEYERLVEEATQESWEMEE